MMLLGVYSHKSLRGEHQISFPQLMYPLFPIGNPTELLLAGPVNVVMVFQVSVSVSYSRTRPEVFTLTYPVQMYPSPPMEKPQASLVPSPPTLAFCAHVLLCGSYCQKSFTPLPLYPVPIYPLLPILKPTALLRGNPGTSAR